MKVNNTMLVLVIALIIIIADNVNGWGIVSFLGDYLVVLLVLALVLGAIGAKTGV